MTDRGYPQQALGRTCFYSASKSHDGMVGHNVYKWKGVFKYTPKVCKNQVVMAGRLLTVLDMRPSTTNNPTSNNDPKFTASPNSTLVWDHTQSQTNLSRSQTSPDSRWHQYRLVAYPSYLTGSSCINYDPK